MNFRISVGAKILGTIIGILIITGVLGIFGLLKMSDIHDSVTTIYTKLKIINAINGANQSLAERRASERQMLIDITKEARGQNLAKLREAEKNMLEFLNQAKSTAKVQEVQDKLTEFENLWNTQASDREIVIAEIEKDNITNAIAELQKQQVQRKQLNDTMAQIVQFQAKSSQEAFNQSEASYAQARQITIITILGAILFGLILGVWVSRMISKPVAEVATTAVRIAQGDLTVKELNITNKDEIGDMGNAFNQMVVSLRQLVGEIKNSANNVASASEQISSASEQVATGSQVQANQMQKISSSVTELAASVQQVASSTQSASAASDQTNQTARSGGETLNKTVQGMNVINDRIRELGENSQKIGAIIQVIDEIANQTNLLALNAAIEAARAGEHGKGFAVVAEEVRKLAERASSATKEIGQLITSIQSGTDGAVKAVQQGSEYTGEAGKAFEEILNVVQRTAVMINEIAAAAEEQAAGSNEVVGAIQSVSAVIQETAASTEETSNSAQELSKMAENLQKVVAQFKI